MRVVLNLVLKEWSQMEMSTKFSAPRTQSPVKELVPGVNGPGFFIVGEILAAYWGLLVLAGLNAFDLMVLELRDTYQRKRKGSKLTFQPQRE